MGDDEICNGAYEKLIQNIDNFHLALARTLEQYNDCQSNYRNSMQDSLDQIEYFSEGDFIKLHHNTKNREISQVCKTKLLK